MALLQRGSSGPEVEDLQRQLSRLGLNTGVVDGKFGPATHKAVVEFQKRRGLEPDGVVGPNTQKEIRRALAEFVSDKGSEPGREDLVVNRSMRLADNQYYRTKHRKDLIVLHHTAGGSARSTFNWWGQDPQHIATPYIVERDGTIHEVFDPRDWAYHLGLTGTNGAVDRRSIGIEIASEGGLRESGGRFYKFDRIVNSTLFEGETYEHPSPWRGYTYYVPYTPKQIDSVVQLTNHLLDTFDISRQTPKNHLDYNRGYRSFKGVLGHHHLRADKSDLHPGFNWDALVRKCRLDQV